MTVQGWAQIAFYLVVLTALTPVLGSYMARVYRNERVILTPVFGPVERLTYRLLRVDPTIEQDWKAYARTTLVFSVLFWLALYLILRTQGIHPFNPEGFNSPPWDVTFNTTLPGRAHAVVVPEATLRATAREVRQSIRGAATRRALGARRVRVGRRDPA